MSQGSSLETVDNLPISDMKNIFTMMSVGAVGPYKDYILTFPLYQQDPKKRRTFEEVFPDINDLMKLKDHRNLTEHEKSVAAARTMLSMKGSANAPAWLKKLATGG